MPNTCRLHHNHWQTSKGVLLKTDSKALSSDSIPSSMQVRSGLGQIASEIMSWTILAFIFGSCVAYIIIVGDNFGAVMMDYVVVPLNLPPILAARQVMILVLSTTIILPISMQRSMVSLAPVSTIALLVMTFTTGAVPTSSDKCVESSTECVFY